MKKTLLLVSIPILVILFSTIGLLITKNTTNRLLKQENSKYECYLNRTIYGTEVATIINKAINQNENNQVQKDEKKHYIENKILAGKELTSTEVSQLVWMDVDINITQIDSVVIGEGRWDITEKVIFKINGRYFSIYYLRGKTETQEDFFPEQIAEEVEPIEIKVIKWIPKRKGKRIYR